MTSFRHRKPPLQVGKVVFLMSTASQFQKCLLVANGDLSYGPAVEKILAQVQAENWAVIAVDGGTTHVLALGLSPDLIMGDMDSVESETLAELESAGTEILRFPPAKDETDLELALLEAVKRGAHIIRIIGAIGGRVDQTIGNIHLLEMPELAEVDVHLVADNQTIWVIASGQHALIGDVGDTISLLPLNQAATDIITTNLEYPLKNETLKLGPARGMSNVIVQPNASVQFATGKLLVIHTLGRA